VRLNPVHHGAPIHCCVRVPNPVLLEHVVPVGTWKVTLSRRTPVHGDQVTRSARSIPALGRISDPPRQRVGTAFKFASAELTIAFNHTLSPSFAAELVWLRVCPRGWTHVLMCGGDGAFTAQHKQAISAERTRAVHLRRGIDR
jgi:hypothetical protein